jgi:hypothetical protein
MPKWEQFVTCTRIIRQHPEWSDKEVLDEARMHPLEIDIVQEARREVDGESLPSDVSSTNQRNF